MGVMNFIFQLGHPGEVEKAALSGIEGRRSRQVTSPLVQVKSLMW